MSMFQVTEGAAANFILPVFLSNPATGNGVAGVGAGAVTARYKREGAAAVDISVVAAGAEGAWQTGGWVAAATLGDGNYELHIPNAAFVTGARWVMIEVEVTGARTERYLLEIGPFEINLAVDGNGVIDSNVITIEGLDATDQIGSIVGADPAAIADAVWDELRAGHTNPGSFGEGVSSVQGGVTGAVGSVTGNVGGNVVGSVNSVTTAVTVTGTPGVNVTQIAGNTAAATNLSGSAQKIILGTVTSATTSSMVAAVSVTGSLLNSTLVFANGMRARVTSYSYSGGNGTFGFSALPSIPTTGSAFAVV